MAKEPWQEDIYENQEETRTQRRKREQGGGVIANRILTILASVFFVIVVVMISFWGISLIASVYLARVSVKPLLESIQKQKQMEKDSWFKDESSGY